MAKREPKKIEKKLNPHDKYFKTVFSYQENMKIFLEKFVPDLVADVDLNTLTLDTNSYVDKKLDEYFTDIVWRVKLKEGILNICFLLEHKSYIDNDVREQIERYMHLMWKNQAQQAKKRGEAFKRFPIIPIIFYHGESPWKWNRLPKEFEHFPEKYHRFIPLFDIIFINLQEYQENQILAMGLGLLGNALLLFKNSKNETALLEKCELLWRDFIDYYEKNDGFRDFIKASIQYFLQNFASNSSNQVVAMDKVQNYFAAPPMRTLYDVIMDEVESRGIKIGEAQGMQIGKAQGMQIGMQIGKNEALQNTIASMWAYHLPMLQIAFFTHSTIEEVQQFMRKIVGEDKMPLIEKLWNDGVSPEAIAIDMNMELTVIQRIINYILDYKTQEDGNKSTES